jgi:hypothetical protein
MTDQAVTPDLARMLMKLCDENVSYLRGAVAAASGLSDALHEWAEDAGNLGNEHHGLRWALEEAEAAVAALSEDLHAAHRVALAVAGMPTAEERLAEIGAGGKVEGRTAP